MNSLVQVACLWALQGWRMGKGQHKLESLPWENGSSFSFLPTELVLRDPQVPTSRLPLPAFGVTGLLCAFLVHGLSCRALPGALLRQLVFPQLCLSYPLALSTQHCSYLWLIPAPCTLNPHRAGTLRPHPSLQLCLLA